MRFKVASDDIVDLRNGILADLEDDREEVYRAENEMEAARKVLELAEIRQKRAQKKVKQLKGRYEIAERMVWPASDEYWAGRGGDARRQRQRRNAQRWTALCG